MLKRLSAAFAMALLSGTALAAAPAPDLSGTAIDSATLADWKAREDAGAQADAAPDAASDAARLESEAGAADEAAEGEATETPPDPFLVRVQILLDRAHASPGVIDGLPGSNTDKAVRAFEEMREVTVDGVIDEELWALLSEDAAPATKTYVVTQEDVDGRFVPDMPNDYAEMAKLDWLGYRDPAEMLAERFHMDEDLLRRLNPDADFASVGTQLLVADTGADPEAKVAHIVVDRSKGELIAFDENDRIVMMNPATIGSEDTPSPSGDMKVNGSAREPTYEYDPDKNFQQGDNREKLTLPGGPNGPVGTVWIDLSKPTYGIHGTPEPSQVSKTASHGCVRLTNWDAEALSRLVQPARTTVEFKG